MNEASVYKPVNLLITLWITPQKTGSFMTIMLTKCYAKAGFFFFTLL